MDKKPKNKKICVICGKEFQPNSGKQITCSKKCRKKRKNQLNRLWYLKNKDRVYKYKPKGLPKKDCIICGRQFQCVSGVQLMCSKECRVERKKMLWHTKYKKRYSKRMKEYYQKTTKKRRKKLKEEILKILGDKCFICGEQTFYFHEIHGKPHSGNLKYILENVKDFIPLCRKCHYILHFPFSRIPNFNLKNFIILFKKISKSAR